MSSPWVRRAQSGTLPSKSDDVFVPVGHHEAIPSREDDSRYEDDFDHWLSERPGDWSVEDAEAAQERALRDELAKLGWWRRLP